MVRVSEVPELYDGGDIGDRPAWKVIKAAVCGASEGDPREDGYCEPQSLYDTAVAFQAVAEVLQRCHLILDKSAKSIAGPDRVWQGPAAEAFLDRMGAHAKVVEQLYQSITGWPGKMGTKDPDNGKNSIVTALVAAANKFHAAQRALDDIDHFHAAQATAQGAGNNKNGTVTVSSCPEIVELLNQDMSKVLVSLQQDYDDRKPVLRAASGGALTQPGSTPAQQQQQFNPSKLPEYKPTEWQNPASTDGTGGTDTSEFGPTPWDSDAAGSYDPTGAGWNADGTPSSYDPTSAGWNADGTPASWGSGGTAGSSPTWDANSFSPTSPTSWDGSMTSGKPSSWDPSTISTSAPYGSGGGSGSYGGGAGGFDATSGTGGLGTGGLGTGGSSGLSGGRGGVGAGTGAGGFLGGMSPGMTPGMGGAGGGGNQERERSTWLVEEKDVWGADPDLPPDVIGRS